MSLSAITLSCSRYSKLSRFRRAPLIEINAWSASAERGAYCLSRSPENQFATTLGKVPRSAEERELRDRTPDDFGAGQKRGRKTGLFAHVSAD